MRMRSREVLVLNQLKATNISYLPDFTLHRTAGTRLCFA
jgi:hypothetical protein